MSFNISVIKSSFQDYNFFKATLHIGNAYTDNWLTPIMCMAVFGLALWVMRDNQVETAKGFSVAILLTFIVSLILLSLQEIEIFVVTIIGILLGVAVIYQKITEN